MGYSVFLSSTWEDMKASYRPAVIQALSRLGVQTVGMEGFGSNTESGDQHSVYEVKSAHCYVLLLGFRYGTCVHGSTKSITQLEYEEACRLHPMPVLVYLASDKPGEIERVKQTFPIGSLDTEGQAPQQLAARERLQEFRDTVLSRHTCSFFTSSAEAAGQIARDVQWKIQGGKILGERELQRGYEALRLGDYASAQFALDTAIREFREAAYQQQAARARFLLALAQLNGSRPFLQPLAGFRAIMGLLDAAIALDPCASYLFVLAACKLDFSRTGMTQLAGDADATLQRAASMSFTSDDDDNLRLFRICQPDLARDLDL